MSPETRKAGPAGNGEPAILSKSARPFYITTLAEVPNGKELCK